MSWKCIIRLCAFIFLGIVLIAQTSYVLRDKTAADRQAPFYDEKKNSIDILLLGPSTMDLAISPMALYQEYGYTSYNLANGGQSLAINYWCLKDALTRQDPELVVLDISYLHMQDILAGQPARLSQFVDNMPLSVNKVKCIMDLTEFDKWKDYLFNIRIYHSRWKELVKSDFTKILSINKGGTISFEKWGGKYPPVSEWDVLEKSDKKSVYEYKISIEYIEKIVSLCEEQGCELLFIKLPAYATGEVNHGNGEELQRLWNGFYDYADDNYLTYINFIHDFDNIDINFSDDFYDWTHMNYLGNCKMTHYLGEYISENYNIEDRRGNPLYCEWENTYMVYETYIREHLKNTMWEDEN